MPEVIVMGTSTGGKNALREIFSRLPKDFSIPILFVQHIGKHESQLPKVLQENSLLPIEFALDNEPIQAGRIVMAPPDHHLLIDKGKVRLSRGPKENHTRPAIDPLFRTAAKEYRENTVGVVLSGGLDDGTIGLQAIKAYGGFAIVQDPADAEESGMPTSAMEYVDVDKCIPLAGIAEALIHLTQEPIQTHRLSSSKEIEAYLEAPFMPDFQELEKIASPSTFTCPECSGTLWEIKNLKPKRFRCHVGHAYTARSLQEALNQDVEAAIWSAIRALHEKEVLMKRMAMEASERGSKAVADEYVAISALAAQQGKILRESVITGNSKDALLPL